MSARNDARTEAGKALAQRTGAERSPTLPEGLSRPEKAAVIIGALGPDAAGPLLELMDESALRAFTAAMSRLRRVDANDVRHTIAEFLDALNQFDTTVRGGLGRAREMLEPHVNESVLNRLLDDVDTPSVNNVWKKLTKVSEDALADFLVREHPQTAAVILSKLGVEHAARVLNRFEPDRARDVVIGITRASSLDPNVIEAIGVSVSRDFLAGHQHGTPRRNPAERVGSILNYASAEIRDHVLDAIEASQPAFAEEIRRKMFTFEDIPKRVEPRDASLIVRQVDQDALLRALRHTTDQSPEAVEFILGNISSRVAEQLRQELADVPRPRRKDGEAAQAEVVAAVRALEAEGRLRLIALEEDV
ncbi:MAG: FliG C-terminal domain-containing protein [Thermohalobaculum sp.]|nr:FliG C-terminal domain-containing protein [Thermohalobaculum sp.]